MSLLSSFGMWSAGGEEYFYKKWSVTMSLQSVLNRVFGSVRVGSGSGSGLGAAAMLMAVVVLNAGVGVDQARAQWCDPVQVAKLLASDGTPNDLFGSSVSISGDTALIGAWGDNASGSAYVFTRSGGVWTQQAKLLASDGAMFDGFGWSVSLSGDTALIGAPFRYDNGDFFSGSVYVFTRSGGVWTQQAKLLPSDGAAYDRFGGSVSLIGDTALIGA